MSESERRQLGVLHSCKTWLPTTQRWLYTQLESLPERVRADVACRKLTNLDVFERSNLHRLDDRQVGTPVADWLLTRLRRWKPLGLLGKHPVHVSDQKRWVQRRMELARRIDADVLHSHFGPIGWKDREVAAEAGLAHVVTFYGYDLSLLPRQEPVWRDRYRQLFETVDRVLCEGPHMGKTVEQLGCPPEKVRVHHLGVDVSAIESRVRNYPEDDEPIRVLLAASFKEKKGLPYGLEALGRVAEDVDLAITLIGQASDEPRSREEAARIEDVIDEYGLDDCLQRSGFVPYDELLAEMLAHDIFLSPSVTARRGDSEGGAPVTIIAAQATGMPVVSTHHADIPNVVDDGQTGYLADERDVPGLVDRLRRLFDEPESWHDLSRAARRRVEQVFDAKKQGKRLAEIYRELSDADES